MNLLIKGGRIIDPENNIDRIDDLFVRDGLIATTGQAPDGFQADHILDAHDHIVMPGIVDMATRLREPGQEHKATIATETRAAAAAGITSLCCLPDTDPVVDTPAAVRLIQQRAESAGFCHVYVIGALTNALDGARLSEMAALKEAGCIGVSNVLQPMASTLVMRRAMEYAASQDLPVFLHPMDHGLADGGCAHEGTVATRLGLPAIPGAAETAAVGQLLALTEQTGARVHFCRLSTARAVNMITRARYEGLPVSADVCAHQLFLTEMDIADFNSLCHTLPPLRSQRDLDGLRHGVTHGGIDALCSDHQPHEADAKRAPFQATEPGISALETLLGLSLRLVAEDVLSLSAAINMLTSAPARVLGIDAGSLSPGRPADICIIDPDKHWQLTAATLLSSGKNTPFSGWEFNGRVSHTLVNGCIVYQATDI